jgi:hypothetical protein
VLARIRRAVTKQNLRAVVAEQFVERMYECALSVEVKAERTQFQFVETDVWKTFNLETERRDGILGFDSGPQPVWSDPLSSGNFQRPQSRVEASFEFAGIAIDGLRVEHGIARDGEPRAEFSLLRIQMELHDGGRRNRTNVMRVENAEQRLRNFREFVVDF